MDGMDGKTLIVGPSASTELLAFDLAEDGVPSNRRVYVQLPQGCMTNGMYVDSEGVVWAASPVSNEFLHLGRDGAITNRVSTGGGHAITCMLGRENLKTLYCMAAANMNLSHSAEMLLGQVETLYVSVRGLANGSARLFAY